MSAKPLIIAHRGASRDAPENTVPAFRLAWAQGVGAIEGDFRLTLDGEIVCFHDADTEKLTGKKFIVAQTTLSTLRKLDIGNHFDSRWQGTRMPTLEEVLETVPEGGKIYIEIKCGPEILMPMHRVIEKSGLKQDHIVIISFNEAVIRALKKTNPQIRAYWLVSFKKTWTGKWKPDLDSVITQLGILKADGLSSNDSALITPEFISKIQSSGFEYHVWTVDNVERARDHSKMGTSSITSNIAGQLVLKL